MDRSSVRTGSADALRLLVVGDSGVGKTSVIHQFVNGEFLFEFEPVIGDKASEREFQVGQEIIRLELWDTFYQKENSGELMKSYLRRADGIVIIYDLSQMDSFKKVMAWHSKIFKALENPSTPFLIFGNKSDLENLIEVDSGEGKKLADSIGASFYEGSALSGLNIREAFGNIVLKGYPRFIERIQARGTKSSIVLTERQSIRKKENQPSKCCQ